MAKTTAKDRAERRKKRVEARVKTENKTSGLAAFADIVDDCAQSITSAGVKTAIEDAAELALADPASILSRTAANFKRAAELYSREVEKSKATKAPTNPAANKPILLKEDPKATS